MSVAAGERRAYHIHMQLDCIYRLPVALLALMGAACGDDATDTTTGAESFACTTDRSGWEQCEGGDVQWCHIDHFHAGARCSALGYACVELSDREASCVDEASTCAVGAFSCDGNTAYNCVEHEGEGRFAIEPCGTAKTCLEDAAEARCEVRSDEACGGHGEYADGACTCDVGYAYDGDDPTTCVVAPAQMCTIFAEQAHSETAATAFEDFASAHAELYVPYEVELPANASAFVHFPVTHDDEFVVFVDQPEALAAVMHRDGTEMSTFHAAGANGACAEAIPEHYHVELAMDAETGPVPYILRFSDQISAPTTVRFMVIDK